MNMKKIILLLAGSMFLSSCVIATPSVTPEVSESGARGEKDRPIHQYTGAVGVYRIELTEHILMSLEGRCNVTRFVIEARKESKIDNVIDIAMIETCSSAEPGKTVCECEYSGIGVLYSEINNPDEASTWMGGVKETSKEKEKNDIPSTNQMAQKRNWKDHVRKETNE